LVISPPDRLRSAPSAVGVGVDIDIHP